MTVRLDGQLVRLEGPCRIEEAEVLHGFLQAGAREVDLSACESLHAALAQVLIAHGANVRGEPADPFLKTHLAPALVAALKATARARNANERDEADAAGGGMEGVRA